MHFGLTVLKPESSWLGSIRAAHVTQTCEGLCRESESTTCWLRQASWTRLCRVRSCWTCRRSGESKSCRSLQLHACSWANAKAVLLTVNVPARLQE